MRLGVNLGYGGTADDGAGIELAREAERLGYSVIWTAEAYGSDAATVLACLACQTDRIDIGSAVFQIPARSPAMTAMTAATLDTLSRGRFRLGLGVSGPQVAEGWYGSRFADPLGRTREYIEIVRMALRRERVQYSGRHYQLPLPDGPGKTLRLAIEPVREPIPVYLAALGPRNLRLTGEIADGWLAVFFSPEHAPQQLEAVREGRRWVGRDLEGFDVVSSTPIVVADDVTQAADRIRGYAALYIGGMGSRERNFYNQLARRMGFEAAAAEVQDRFLARDYEAAQAAVPFEFIDQTSLLGPVPRIADRMRAYAEAGVTTLSIAPHAATHDERIATLRAAVEALDRAGVGE